MTNKTILVVEDEILLLDLICTELEEAGYKILKARNGEEAMAYLRGPQSIDLLFTDIRFPGSVDGWQLASVACQLRSSIKIVYATGFTAERPPSAGDSVFFTKPYRPLAILTAVRNLLGTTSSSTY